MGATKARAKAPSTRGTRATAQAPSPRGTRTKAKKIGILVVAYNAATTLHKVLDRIPESVRADIQEVIVSDDHSQDST